MMTMVIMELPMWYYWLKKSLPANAGEARDWGLTPELRRSPGGGNGNPLQYSCLENSKSLAGYNPGVTKSQTLLSNQAHGNSNDNVNIENLYHFVCNVLIKYIIIFDSHNSFLHIDVICDITVVKYIDTDKNNKTYYF